MKRILLLGALFSNLYCTACFVHGQKTDQVNSTVLVKDAHTLSNVSEVYCTHLFLDVQVNFERKMIEGIAHWNIKNQGNEKQIVFDTKGLNIKKVIVDNKHEANFTLGKTDDLLGTSLIVPISKRTKKISIYYNTTEGSEALQWLSAQQTGGKKYPYLFTQGEAILTRTWIPCQDSPARRITYSAKVKVPKDLMAVMSADNPIKKSENGIYTFEMKQPVPTYLIALAVGDLEYRKIGDRTGIYTEPSMIDKAANEFADMEKMLIAAEKLYGKYKWGKYDVIVLPPSFPFGGMENPKLTFATPTLIAGDRSLTSVIAHEMAHSWSGNLVTNATWDDFWLNEGFTVYFERRIMEELYGADYTNMLALLGYQDLLAEVEGLSAEDTRLKLDLCKRNPDDGMTEIAYEKGAFFLKMLEDAAGRENFDKFLKGYFEKFQFQTMTTEKFVDYLNAQLIQKYDLKDLQIDNWIYKQGIPSNVSKIESDRFVKVDEKLKMWTRGTPAQELGIKEWSTHEWLHFLRQLPRDLNLDQMKELDAAFSFTASGNAEILTEWFKLCIDTDYSEAYDELEHFLVNVGRRKFLRPLYAEMVKTEKGTTLAKKIYEKARENYHSVSYNTIDAMLGWKE